MKLQRTRTLGVATALAFGLASVAAAARQEPVTGTDLDSTRAALERWVETRRLISQEKRDWVLGKEVLEDRIELVRTEITALREKIEAAREQLAQTEEKRSELEEQNRQLIADSGALGDRVGSLEGRTRALLQRLPVPLQERVRPLSQRFPEDPAQAESSLSERFQSVVGVLNAVNAFHGEVSLTSEVRTLADGTSAEVAALYVGISKGYYVTADERSAGVGSGVGETWSWTPDDGAAKRVRQAIGILENTEPAAFVELPAGLAKPAAQPEPQGTAAAKTQSDQAPQATPDTTDTTDTEPQAADGGDQ